MANSTTPEWSFIWSRTYVAGVPQWSILEPPLFTLYTLEMCKVFVSCSYHSYADVTQVFLSYFPEDISQANTN